MRLRHLLLIALCSTFGLLQAQDIHFSLYNMSPLTLNPALSGAFEGTARIGGIYRDQWASFLNKQFVTPSFYVDAPIIRGLRKQDWVGVGGMTFNDQAGTAKLRTVGSMFSAAYHMGFDKGNKNVLTIGFQGGSVQRRIDIQSQNLKFEDELPESVGGGGAGVGNGGDRQLNDNVSYMDFSTGAMLRSAIGDKDKLELGMSFAHLTQPRYNLISSGNKSDDPRRPMRMSLHGQLRHQLNEKLHVTPSFLVQSTKTAREIALQAMAGYQINPDVNLRIGPGYRFGDAAQVLLGVDYKDLRVAASYDVNVSSLSEVSNLQGGFEIAAWYIVKIYKKPKISPAILCPQF